MLAQGTGGCLLFNVSKQAVNPGPNFGPYGLPKAATLFLVRQYALDYGADGIRANAVNADRIRSGLLTDDIDRERVQGPRRERERTTCPATCCGREVTAEDVAQAFLHQALAAEDHRRRHHRRRRQHRRGAAVDMSVHLSFRVPGRSAPGRAEPGPCPPNGSLARRCIDWRAGKLVVPEQLRPLLPNEAKVIEHDYRLLERALDPRLGMRRRRLNHGCSSTGRPWTASCRGSI